MPAFSQPDTLARYLLFDGTIYVYLSLGEFLSLRPNGRPPSSHLQIARENLPSLSLAIATARLFTGCAESSIRNSLASIAYHHHSKGSF